MQPSRLLSVLILEDDPGNRSLLGDYARVAGYRPIEVATPAEAVAALEADATICLILSDLRVPTIDAGVEFIRSVGRRSPTLPLAVVTGFPEALQQHDVGPAQPQLVITKPFRGEHIEGALALGLSGGAGSQPPAEPRTGPTSVSPPPAVEPLPKLTLREGEVWRVLAEGCTNKEIAANLSISVKTVESHVTSLRRKLGARSRVEAVLRGSPAAFHSRDGN